MEWLISVFLEEFLLTNKEHILKKRSDQKRVKRALESIFSRFRKKYESELFYYDLDNYFSENKLVQKLAGSCIAMWKANTSFLSTLDEIADRFIDEYPKYSPYRTTICNGLKDIFESCFKEINGMIESDDLRKATNQILADNDRNRKKITESLDQIRELLAGRGKEAFGNELSIEVRKKNIDFSIVTRCMNGSVRENEVTYILKKLKETSWIHIRGEIWSGKTQFLKLISDRVYAYKYIDLDKISRHYGINDIYTDMAVSAGCDSAEKETIIAAFVDRYLADGVLFLDGIHEAVLDDTLMEMIALFSTKCREKGAKLVTCGYMDITAAMKTWCNVSDVFTYDLPKLSQPEVEEMMVRNGMPEHAADMGIIKFLAEVFGNIPAVVMELIYELKERNWNLDASYYSDLIMAKADGVEKQLERVIFSRIADKDVRTLLYRLAGVEHDIPVKVLPKIGDIYPKIEQLDKARYLITSRWGSEKEGMITIPRIFKNIADKHLTEKEKEELHLIMVDYYKEKKVLDEIEATHFMMHFMDLQRYDEMGQLYVHVLESMIGEGIVNSICHFAFFWAGTTLPKEMSLSVQAIVRVEQVRYLSFADMDYTYQFDDLMRIAGEEPEGGQILFFAMALIKNDDFPSHRKCMDRCLELDLWGEEEEKLTEYLDSLEEIRWSQFDMSFFEFFLIKYSLTVHHVKELALFLTQLEKVSPLRLEEVIDHQEKVLFTLMERVRIHLEDAEKNSYGRILEEWRTWTKENGLHKLCRQAGVSYLRFLFETQKEYDAAAAFFETERAEGGSGQDQHELVDAMAKLLYECKETDTNRALIGESYFSLPEHSEAVFEDVYTCLLFMESADQENNMQTAEKMLCYAAQPDEDWEAFAVGARAKAEYYLNAYLCGRLGSEIEGFGRFVMDLIEEKGAPKRALLLTLLANDLIFIAEDVIYHDPPKALLNGEEYAKPERKRYWLLHDEKAVEELYSEEKTAALQFVVAELLEFYGYQEEADRICDQVLGQKGIVKTALAYFLANNSYLLLKLMTYDKWELLFGFLVFLDRGHDHCEDDISVPLKILLVLSAYMAHLSRNGDFSKIPVEKIKQLGNLELCASWKACFAEYGKIMQVFVQEEGDTGILSECAKRVEDTSLDTMRAVVYVLMYPRVSKEARERIDMILQKISANLKLENDYFYRKLIQ